MRFLRSDSSIFTNQYGLTEWGSYSSIFWRTKSNLLFGGLIRQFFDERTRIHFSRSDSSIFWRTKKIIEPKIRVRQRIDGFFRWLTNRPEKWSRASEVRFVKIRSVLGIYNKTNFPFPKHNFSADHFEKFFFSPMLVFLAIFSDRWA